MTGEEWLTTPHAARLLGVHPQTLKKWSDMGMLTYHQTSPRGRRRFRRAELDRFIRSTSKGNGR